MAADDPEMLPEYDFATMGTPTKGKHYEKYRRYIRTIELDEKLAQRFPDEQSVLLALASYAAEHPEQEDQR